MKLAELKKEFHVSSVYCIFIIGLITIYRACKAGLPGGLLPRIPV
jgi:hypothetical protein